MSDDLTKPLGLSPPRHPRRPPPTSLIVAAVVVVVALLGGGTWLTLHHRSSPGPEAAAVVNQPPAAAPSAPAKVAAPAPSGSALTEMTPTGNLSEVGKVVVSDPSQPAPVTLTAAPVPALVEDSSYGPLPKVGADGTRPLDAYARPSSAASGSARVAIVIGGVGIDADGSRQAIALPGATTLALAPYGSDLKGLVAEARAAGHELLLQVPLEPFNYPTTDPGPRTLTVKASPSENLNRLHWLMSRATNYVGVVNYMGARFTSEPDALAPVLAEIGRRGLLYLDDGSSALSQAVEQAGNTPVLRADVVLDADLNPAAIDQQLDRLREIARQRGYAIATGSAFATTIDRVAAFARRAADRGVTIVPLSSLVSAGHS
jgi:polysaccharide deacetylase 2 family uncharacterized protein YibQ